MTEVDLVVLPVLLLLGGQTPDKSPIELKSRIVEASVFKSGLVMLTREVTVPAGSGTYQLDVLPSALDGTFWYGTPDQLSVSDVSTTLRITDKKQKVTAGSILELLSLNVGKRVTIIERPTVATTSPMKVTGKVLQTQGSQFGGGILIQLDNGGFYSPNWQSIAEVQGKDLKSTSDRTTKGADIRIQFKAKATGPSRMQFIDLETGAAWTGSYLVKLGADNTAEVQGKAQLAVGGLRFKNTDVKAMAGEPNLPTGAKFDLASGYGSLMAYLSNSQDRYRPYRADEVDPYTLLPSLNNFQGNPYGQNAYIGGMGGGMGGFGGGGVGGPAAMGETTDLRNLPEQPEANRLETLYSYPMGDLDLEPGDRITRMLFSQKAKYESLFKWQADGNNTTVSNTVRLTNASRIPWTGGPAMVIKDGMPLAQLPMSFTAVGNVADLDLGVARDVIVHREDRQLRIEENSPNIVFGYSTKKSIQEIRLVVENTRNDPVKLEINTSFTGEAIDDAGATVTQLPNRGDTFNWQRGVRWNLTLNGKERRELVFTYGKVFRDQ